jgi:DNA-damage-inducible protein J
VVYSVWSKEETMASTNINVRTNSVLKAKAQSVFNDLGLDMSTAINIFLSQVVLRQAVPFEIAKPARQQAKLGGWEGKIQMADDFNAPMEEFREYTEE